MNTQEISRTAQKNIDEIMDYFDFSRVHRVMSILDWKWATLDNTVPSESELRLAARVLMLEAVGHERTTLACGGLVIRRWGDDSLELSFHLTSWLAETD